MRCHPPDLAAPCLSRPALPASMAETHTSTGSGLRGTLAPLITEALERKRCNEKAWQPLASFCCERRSMTGAAPHSTVPSVRSPVGSKALSAAGVRGLRCTHLTECCPEHQFLRKRPRGKHCDAVCAHCLPTPTAAVPRQWTCMMDASAGTYTSAGAELLSLRRLCCAD